MFNNDTVMDWDAATGNKEIVYLCQGYSACNNNNAKGYSTNDEQ